MARAESPCSKPEYSRFDWIPPRLGQDERLIVFSPENRLPGVWTERWVLIDHTQSSPDDIRLAIASGFLYPPTTGLLTATALDWTNKRVIQTAPDAAINLAAQARFVIFGLYDLEALLFWDLAADAPHS